MFHQLHARLPIRTHTAAGLEILLIGAALCRPLAVSSWVIVVSVTLAASLRQLSAAHAAACLPSNAINRDRF